MANENFLVNAKSWLNELCLSITDRSVGTAGNLAATDFFYNKISEFGFKTEKNKFECMDWTENGAVLKAGEENFRVFPGPYSPGCDVSGILCCASTADELSMVNAENKILLLYGDITKEQLMPKNFVFYNPEEHRKIVSLLEKSGAKAIITATGRNSELAGGVYPFPVIEDGDFNIPSVYMTDMEGEKLLKYSGRKIYLKSEAQRISSEGYNVIASKGKAVNRRIVITAHIDAKKGSPGAIDNASGIIVLLLLAEMLKDYRGDTTVEIAALNGEDYYIVPGQMQYISMNEGRFSEIILAVNIDGAGFFKGYSEYSLYEFSPEMSKTVREVFDNYSGICEGPQWLQGDHSIFVQEGRPAIAFSSGWLIQNISTQDITHTPEDNPGIVDCSKLVEIASALKEIIEAIDRSENY